MTTKILKMRTVKGQTYVYDGDKEMCFGEGIKGIRRAIHYVNIKIFFALVDGKPIGARNNTLYPVKSLVPVITRPKRVTLINLDEEVG